MNALYAMVFVFALVLVALFGVGAAHLGTLFGVAIPYAAVVVFLAGFAYRMIDWAKSPVPYRIPTTGGQQKSDLDFVTHSRWDNPATPGQTWIRMIFEVLLFRSLFRNTKVGLFKVGAEPKVAYFSAKFLWLFAILFHYCFFLIVLRHTRLFFEPVPFFAPMLETMDGIFQVGIPRLYQTDIMILLALGFLLIRRLWDPKIRYISLFTDYFPLLLIIAIAVSGIYMRYVAKVDVVAIKEFTMGLLSFHPVIPQGIDVSFFIHLFLVCVLLFYFPFSKLMHLGGVFLSPTRNMPNDSRVKHHVNPWNDPEIKPHSYEHYEDDFRELMAEAGLPLEKEPEDAQA